MSIDFNSPDLQLLLRQFQTGNAILFAGAGFSVSASNAEGTDPPTSQSLAERLSVECGWSYSGEALPLVYGQAEKHVVARVGTGPHLIAPGSSNRPGSSAIRS